MQDASGFIEMLQDISDLCPSGYAVALHVRFAAPTYLFQTYGSDWIEYYSRRGFVLHDPTVHWGLANSGICNWDDLEAQDPKGILAAARKHGMTYGFAIALDTDNSRSVGNFTRNDRPHTADEVKTIQQIMQDLHKRTVEPKALSLADRRQLHDLSVEHSRR